MTWKIRTGRVSNSLRMAAIASALGLVLAAGEAAASWQSSGGPDGLAVAEDGVTQVSFRCGGGRVFIIISGYPGQALPRVDDVTGPIQFEVDVGRGTALHVVSMHYFAPDRAWVSSDPVGGVLLDDWARGTRMAIRAQDRDIAFRVGLQGTGPIRQAIRQSCRF